VVRIAGDDMKDLKTMKDMKGGWQTTPTWLPSFAGLGLWGTATDKTS
jgi:hypothetical protein